LTLSVPIEVIILETCLHTKLDICIFLIEMYVKIPAITRCTCTPYNYVIKFVNDMQSVEFPGYYGFLQQYLWDLH